MVCMPGNYRRAKADIGRIVEVPQRSSIVMPAKGCSFATRR
jgi:hypothetical protein